MGDSKSPDDFQLTGTEYFDIKAQSEMSFKLSKVLPTGTYSRKMIGYLIAARKSCETIFETDDDNYLLSGFFGMGNFEQVELQILSKGFINHHKLFTQKGIWPRGFPLELLPSTKPEVKKVGTQDGFGDKYLVQGLANGEPDVDAIYRLVRDKNSEFTFDAGPPVILDPGPQDLVRQVPLNSQVTLWRRELLPLMYLPVTCSFRMTDIWRGYIAQRLLAHLGGIVLLQGPLAYQDRNEHNLLKDFEDEIEGYLGYSKFVQALNEIELSGMELFDSLRHIYKHLIIKGYFKEDEMKYVEAWVEDLQDE